MSNKKIDDEEQFTVEELGELDSPRMNSDQDKSSSSTLTPEKVREMKMSTHQSNSLNFHSQDLFAKYVKLETDYKDLQRNLDQANNEKIAQEKVIKIKDAELLKVTVEYESAREKIEKLQDSIRLKEMEINNLGQEKKTLEELSALNQLSVKRQKDTETRSRKNIAILPEDSLDRIIQLENELKIRDSTISALNSEIKTLRLLGERKEKALEKTEKNLKETEFRADK